MEIIVDILPYLIGVCLVAVVVTLLAGVSGMAKGGAFNARNSNRLMRWRVGFQALAVALIVVYSYLLSQGQ
jgi:hypothetical protein